MDSTVRRSNLSREKMAVLEALSNYKNEEPVPSGEGSAEISEETSSPEVYVRKNRDKSKELDLLWKDFKLPRGEHSPIVFLGIGFVSGVISTLIVSACIGLSLSDLGSDFKFPWQNAPAAVETSVPADSEEVVSTTETTAAASDETADVTVEETSSRGKFGFFGGTKKAKEEVTTPSVQDKEYIVQSGDTMESIVKKFYGQYSSEKVESIMKINNMTNPNKLAIDQKLIIPDVPAQTDSNVSE